MKKTITLLLTLCLLLGLLPWRPRPIWEIFGRSTAIP